VIKVKKKSFSENVFKNKKHQFTEKAIMKQKEDWRVRRIRDKFCYLRLIVLE
jgi:hypothetical protein